MDNKKDQQVVDFVEKLKTQKDLQEYAKAQFAALLQANRQIEALEQENQALKALVSSTSKVSRIPKSSEEMTCELEIGKLRTLSLQRSLIMDEVKKLEILVKTLYAAKAHSSETAGADFQKLGEFSETDLIAIATNKSDSNEGS